MFVETLGYLTVEQFGVSLVNTGDLDPEYIALVKANLPPKVLHQWLVSHFLFHHMGVNCWLGESTSFWDDCLHAANNPTNFPRGFSRRHFRPDVAVFCIESLQKKYSSASSFIQMILEQQPVLEVIREKIEEHPMFGPWASFKIADMVDRVLNVPIVAIRPGEALYRGPISGARVAYKQWYGDIASDDQCVATALGRLEGFYKQEGVYAPPFYDRPLGLFEIETILCKIKAHRAGRYPVGKDIKIQKGELAGWGTLADKIGGCLPSLVS